MAISPLKSSVSPFSPLDKSEPRIEQLREYYGFALYLMSIICFGVYVSWALLPDSFLSQLGITYYPNRQWAVIVPIWMYGCIPFSVLLFMSMNLYMNPSMDSFYTISDEKASIVQHFDAHRLLDYSTIPELQDIPIHHLSRVLYSSKSMKRHQHTAGLLNPIEEDS